jgi:hypothetical protein
MIVVKMCRGSLACQAGLPEHSFHLHPRPETVWIECFRGLYSQTPIPNSQDPSYYTDECYATNLLLRRVVAYQTKSDASTMSRQPKLDLVFARRPLVVGKKLSHDRERRISESSST